MHCCQDHRPTLHQAWNVWGDNDSDSLLIALLHRLAPLAGLFLMGAVCIVSHAAVRLSFQSANAAIYCCVMKA